MKKNTLTAFLLTLFASVALVFSGCGGNDFEDAGEEVDEAVEEVGDEVDDATD